MDRQLVEVSSLSLSFCLFLWLSTYLPNKIYKYSLSLSLSVRLSIYISVYLSIYLPIYLSTYLSIHPSIYYLSIIYLSIHRSIHPSIYLSIYLSLSLSLCLPVCLSIYLSVYLQAWKRSYSARLPQFLNLTTSKTQQFCKTSSIFELDNSETILRDFLQKWKVECSADGLVPMRFAIFPLHLSKVLRLLRKSDARSYEVLQLSRKIILANLQIWCSKMQPLSGNQRPDLLTFLMNMSFVLRLPCEMHLWRCSSNVPRLPSFLEMLQHPHVLLIFKKVRNPLLTCWLRNVLRATTACTFSTSQLPKVVRTWCALCIFTSKCPSRHNGVHFFDISTSKSALRMVCFVHFDFDMCFAPQRRALFRHLNFQFCTFWLRNVLRATTVYTFATSQHPKMLRTWGVLYILTSKCASCHNGAQFFISHLPTFQPSGATNHWKNIVFRDFPTFSRTWASFFWLFLFSDLLSSTLLFSLTLPVSAFHLSILSEVWLLNFLR